MYFGILLIVSCILFALRDINAFEDQSYPQKDDRPGGNVKNKGRYEEWDPNIPIGTCPNLVRLLHSELHHLRQIFPEEEKEAMTQEDCDTLRELVLYTPNCPKDDEDVVDILIQVKDSGYCNMNERIVVESRQPFGNNFSERTAKIYRILIVLMVTFVCVCYFLFGI